jgi:DnaJ-class molecular chaperone
VREPHRNKRLIVVMVLLLSLPVVIFLQSRWISKNQQVFKKGMFLQLQIKKVECDHCGGTGLVTDAKKPGRVEICPVCFGVGSHAVRKLDPQDALCLLCGGMGRVYDEQAEIAQTCPRCDGRGLIRLQENATGVER